MVCDGAHDAALAWMEREFVKPFPLYEGPLFRFALCKVAEDCYYWLKKYHHIIADGWAISLIVQRVASVYNALAGGEAMEAQTHSYRDFIGNDKDYLGSEKFTKAKDYWRNKYREIPEPLLSPRHAARFQGRTIPTLRATLRLPRGFYNRLIAFAEDHRVSTFHVILGALYCYFTRAHGRADLAIGLPTLNRINTAFKRTVGVFAGISPAWFRFGTDLGFMALMEKLRKELQADYRHQRLPMSEINRQSALQYGERLFDVTLSYARHDYDVHFGGNPAQAIYLSNGSYPQSHGLFVTVEEFHQHDDVNVYFDYNLAFFDEAGIERLKTALFSLLETILRKPDTPIRELPITSPDETDEEEDAPLCFHHNGFACENIQAGIEYVRALHGIRRMSDVVFDERQDASVCFIETRGGAPIELVAGNRVRSLLDRGTHLYHVCYEVPDLFRATDNLMAVGASMIAEPKPAPLFDNRRVTFLDTPLGLVELLEKTPSATSEAPAQARRTLAIAATFTAEPVQDSLDFWLADLGLPFDIAFAPYNQVFQQLLDPKSLVAGNRAGINVLLMRFQDWGKPEGGEIDTSAVRENVRQFAEILRSTASGTFIVCICPAPPETIHAGLYRERENWLVSELEETGNCHAMGSEEWMKNYPVERFDDPDSEEIGHVPYTPAFFAALGAALARKIHATGQLPYKVIVLDCDNTLWRGVRAEDGLTGIHLGAPHLALQRFMLAQQAAGKLLCLCSKNREDDVLSVFEKRSDMVLRREHLAGWRINWQPKSDNIRALAEELNLGLSSFIFVDDNPVECAEVEARCPEVTAIHLPADPNRWAVFLQHVWAFDTLKVTAEDRQRTRYYQADRERHGWRREAMDFGAFLAGLELEVVISPLSPPHVGRVAQLTQRTNQFNFTTVRRTEAEVQVLCEPGEPSGQECLTVTVKDRFGEYGLVGVVIFDMTAGALRVDTFLLSCRALGRGVEHRMLARLGEIAKERDCNAVEIPYIPTEKNQPALTFLESVGEGFRESLARGWRFNLPTERASKITLIPDEETQAPESSRNAPEQQGGPEASSAVVSEVVASPSALFQRIATALCDADAILAEIKLRARRQTRERAGEYVPPRTPEEELLAGIWADVLNVDQVGIHDNFFRLGGHSLLGAQVISRIRDTFANELPLHALFEEPTIAGLASRFSIASRDAAHSTDTISPPITPVDRARPLPLSFAQQRLWFLDRLEGKSATYNIVAAARLDGDLNRAAMEKSLTMLVARHESLRAVFPTVEGAPVTRITDEPWALAISDLGHLPEPEREPAALRLLAEEALHLFDLAAGPLFRARLIRLGDAAHILAVNLHHIITDGWSLGIFVREWKVLYEAALRGQSAPLPDLSIQYVDFANWQREQLTGETLETQLDYWRTQLADAPTLLELPTDHPRPPVQRYRGASLTFSLPDKLTAQLRGFGQETGATLFMTLWSAFAVLLSRYSGQDDVSSSAPPSQAAPTARPNPSWAFSSTPWCCA